MIGLKAVGLKVTEAAPDYNRSHKPVDRMVACSLPDI